ncbi:DUF2290 domain-containing protein [Tumidithrix helvetica PCC 7403]|uniref:DUF2290 domain-containing protein n=1 Tax=Tumidithrix helvetica TaxID=3457545 RepID=UPI003CBAD4FC
MTSYQSILNQIKIITEKLILVGLSESQNFPSTSSEEGMINKISYSGIKNLAITLKNIEYIEVYEELDKNRDYNIKMIDGALLQFLYTYKSSELISHRLAFFPSPFLHNFQNEPEIYETDDIYADIIAKNILPVPIRFDYDPDNFIDLEHPNCHLTLGQFKNCRIPVSAPITPNTFISFILRSFYNTAFTKFTDKLDFSGDLFDDTITIAEKKVLHFAVY